MGNIHYVTPNANPYQSNYMTQNKQQLQPVAMVYFKAKEPREGPKTERPYWSKYCSAWHILKAPTLQPKQDKKIGTLVPATKVPCPRNWIQRDHLTYGWANGRATSSALDCWPKVGSKLKSSQALHQAPQCGPY